MLEATRIQQPLVESSTQTMYGTLPSEWAITMPSSSDSSPSKIAQIKQRIFSSLKRQGHQCAEDCACCKENCGNICLLTCMGTTIVIAIICIANGQFPWTWGL